MKEPENQAKVVGVVPWLPWPLSASSWWTQPVRAERLAVVRIGVCVFMLYDLLFQYYPCLHALHGPRGITSAGAFAEFTESPHWNWSIFRGLDHSLVSTLALLTWLISVLGVGWCLFQLVGNPTRSREVASHIRGWVIIWLVAAGVYLLGLWMRALSPDESTLVIWLIPVLHLVIVSATLTFHCIVVRKHPSVGSSANASLTVLWFASLVLVVLSFVVWFGGTARTIFQSVFRWDTQFSFLRGTFLVWIVATYSLCLGLFTRPSAILVWVLDLSFRNLNPEMDSGGDYVKHIILFYLMLSPCGAVWSLDRLLFGSSSSREPVVIAPWPLRLLFVQLVCIYFFSGVVKLLGSDWIKGDSLYYALCDLHLARFSYAQLPAIPIWLLRLLTWTILVWEVGFPLWILWKWTRWIALGAGVCFHTGTLLLLELGGFEHYMFVLYLPLLPWDRWSDRLSKPASSS